MNLSRICRLLCLLIGFKVLPDPCSAQTNPPPTSAQIVLYDYSRVVNYLSIDSDAYGIYQSWYVSEDLAWHREWL